VLACGARSSLDDYTNAGPPEASVDVGAYDAVENPIQHADEPGIAVGWGWVCVYRPGMKSGCTGTFVAPRDASAVELPEHMWAFTSSPPLRATGSVAACGMTPSGMTCWGQYLEVPATSCVRLAEPPASPVCQPTVVNTMDFVWVAPSVGLDAHGGLFAGSWNAAFAPVAQPEPLMWVDPNFPLARGVDLSGRVMTWSGTCEAGYCGDGVDTPHNASVNAPAIAALDFRAVGVATNLFGACAWDAPGHVACWGDPAMTGGSSTSPYVVHVPPARTVIADSASMCGVGFDGSVTCFGCTKSNASSPCVYTQGYQWGFLELDASPETIALPQPVIAIGSGWGVCALVADQTVWCWGPALGSAVDAPIVPWHVVALDP